MATETANDNSKATKETLLTLPDGEELIRWIMKCKADRETSQIKSTQDILTGIVAHDIEASHPDKTYDPSWPVFVGYPFTRSVKQYDLKGNFSGYRQELIDGTFYAQVADEGKKRLSKAQPVPFDLIPLIEDMETQCLVCVRSDVYER